MEKLPNNQKESGISRIVGVEKSTEKSILDFFKTRFESEQKNTFEKEHTKELDDLINIINDRLRDFLKKYDINSIPIPTKNIHIVDQAKLTPQQIEALKQRYEEVKGLYIPSKQHIGMLMGYEDGKKLAFLQTLIHEILHLNSFFSFQKLPADKSEHGYQLTKEPESGEQENISLGMRRMGFRIQTIDGETYFYNMDEALITELTMRFDWKYFSQFPELSSELERRQEVINAQSRRSGESTDELKKHLANMEERQEKNDSWVVTLKGYSYDKERAALNKLIDDLFEKNKSDFLAREDIFDIFAKASMTGKLLPIARLIEKTFGKGSFRKLGEATEAKK